ncbi:hypothetical protein LguiB_013072 [Lonicera macranthoides]
MCDQSCFAYNYTISLIDLENLSNKATSEHCTLLEAPYIPRGVHGLVNRIVDHASESDRALRS